ncbi:MAG: DUF1684 domain-containing protein [Flavisolibacter sp.]|jgi:uncharacterized protein (DUF1684 family)
MKKNYFLLIFAFSLTELNAQSSYKDSITTFVKSYVSQHEVVKGNDRKYLHFYSPDPRYRVTARFEKKENGSWFQIPTSGKIKKTYRVFGVLHFTIHDTLVHLNLYQSQDLMQNDQYKNYLFLPFTDLTTGVETYESGRYIDLTTEEIKNNQVIIDFNKAYNPYCAYVSGVYNCPVPPRENHLNIAIKAGEKKYGKMH